MIILGQDRSELLVRWALPLAVLAFFSSTASGYGVFRDELYYIACAQHLDWGYVDHPPLVALIAWSTIRGSRFACYRPLPRRAPSF